MKTIFTFLLGILFSFYCFSQPAIQWQKALGGSSDEYARSIQQTVDGGYIAVGMSSSTDGDVTGNHGESDYWIVKMDATGAIQWQKTFGGSGLDSVTSVKQTSDGAYIVAGTTNSTDGDVVGNHGGYDGWVLKLNATGTIQWQKTLGGSNWDGTQSIQQTTDGGYIVAGYTGSIDGDITLNHGGTDYWIIKLNTIGTIEWQKAFGGTGQDYAWSIQQTVGGGYIVAGESNSIDGDVTGNLGSYDYWVIKLDATGTMQWQKSFGGSYVDGATSIQQTADGGYIVAGNKSSNSEEIPDGSLIVKLDAAGAMQWQKELVGSSSFSSYRYANSIQQTTDGGYIVAGYVYVVTGNLDYWVVKLDATGTIQWQKTLGGSADDRAFSVQQTTEGGYIISGMSNSTDGDVTGNNGSYDYWIVKLEANLSTSDFEQERIVIFPNPARSMLNLQLPDDVLIDKIIIIDLTGKIIMEQTKNTTQVNTEGLASGMYLIQAISMKNKWQSKFIIE
jgi:type IX secretion system substrate protein